jgi:hypothetical protein
MRVTFNGTTQDFRSAAEAFRALRLPMSKCIRFRGEVKAKGKAVFERNGGMYAFEAVAAAQ